MNSIEPSLQGNVTGNVLFNSFINLLNLKQCNCIKNSLGRTLDCIFLSSEVELTSIVHSSESVVPIIDDHHPPLELYIQFTDFSLHNSYEFPLVYNFKNCNFNEISLFLSKIDFELNLDNNLSFDAQISKFYEIIYHTFSLHVHKTKIFNNFSPVWANAELRKLIIDKKCAHKKFKLSHSQRDYLIFSNIRKKCKQLVSFCHTQLITNIENSIQTSIKPFWKYINSQKKLTMLYKIALNIKITHLQISLKQFNYLLTTFLVFMFLIQQTLTKSPK